MIPWPLEWSLHHRFSGLEFDWLARDRDGHVAYFASGGCGPMPPAAAEHSGSLELFELATSHPVWCEAVPQAVPLDGDYDDWKQIARRGIFAFDWRRDQEVYVLLYRPSRLVPAAELFEATFLVAAGAALFGGSWMSASKLRPTQSLGRGGNG